MLFPYVDDPANGDFRRLPQVPIEVHGAEGSVSLQALVDSGAEHNVLGLATARQLGISIESEIPATLIGVGGGESQGWLTVVEMQIGDRRWATPAIFAEAGDHQALLGQEGFFAFFTVTFRYRQRVIEVT